MSALSPEQIKGLSKDLSSTLSDSDLAEIVHISTGDELYKYWVPAGQLPLIPTIRALLLRLEEEGLTSKFLKEVYLARPFRADIQALIAGIYPEATIAKPTLVSDFSVQKQGVHDAELKSTLLPGLQKNVKPHLQQLDILTWVERLLAAKRRTCRIDLNGSAAGSGFLVGPDAVLTNWHVVEPVIAARRVAELSCRFDYAIQSDGIRNQGQVVPLAENGVVHHRPYAPAETTATPDAPPPAPSDLDFALLRLSRAIGDEVEGTTKRGWIGLPTVAAPLPAGSPIIIVQHPDGAPMKMAIDTEAVLDLPPPPDRPRIRYATNTEPGSSGSPCFTMDWNVVALHHFGDPAWQTPKFNQGIPLPLIRADIEAAGHAGLLGPILAM